MGWVCCKATGCLQYQLDKADRGHPQMRQELMDAVAGIAEAARLMARADARREQEGGEHV